MSTLASKHVQARERLKGEVDALRNDARDLARILAYIDELEKKVRKAEAENNKLHKRLRLLENYG